VNKKKQKILVIGDSHVAGFKKAAHSLKIKATYIVSASNEPINLKLLTASLEDGFLSTTNEKLLGQMERYGSTEAKIDLFDVVYLVGLRTEFPYKSFNDFNAFEVGYTSSNSAFIDTLRDFIVHHSIMYHLVKEIRKINSTITIKIIPNPLLSEELQNMTIYSAPGIYPQSSYGGAMSIKTGDLDKWIYVLKECFAADSVELCSYPLDFITNEVFTRKEYCLGNKNAGEIRHMNPQYWNEYLKLSS
jgi:hypothetical protein